MTNMTGIPTTKVKPALWRLNIRRAGKLAAYYKGGSSTDCRIALALNVVLYVLL